MSKRILVTGSRDCARRRYSGCGVRIRGDAMTTRARLHIAAWSALTLAGLAIAAAAVWDTWRTVWPDTRGLGGER